MCGQTPAGSYSPVNDYRRTVCPKGTYSLAGAGSCTNCAAGKYGSETGLTTANCSGLISCGYYGGEKEETATPSTKKCAAGYYSAAGSDASTDCVNCGAGYWCAAGSCDSGGTVNRTACAANTYSTATNATADTTCTTCPNCGTSAAGSDALADCSAGCTGKENSICDGTAGTCVNKCLLTYYPADHDLDGYDDVQDSDCGTGGCSACKPAGGCCDNKACFCANGTVWNGTSCAAESSSNWCATGSTYSCIGAASLVNTLSCNGTTHACDQDVDTNKTLAENCTGGTPYCSTTTGRCVQCNLTSQCSVLFSWAAPYTCSGNDIYGAKTYKVCSSGTCTDTTTSTLKKSCGGELNARCVNGYDYCVNQCGTTNNTVTACGGCGSLCTSGTPFCNPVTNCNVNGANGTGCNSSSGGAATLGQACVCNSSTKYYASGTGLCTNSSATCATGKYAYGVSFGQCNNCPAGSYGQSAGVCVACPAGTYSNAGATGSCTNCTMGYWCTAGIRIPCPAGTTSSGGATSITACSGSGSGS